MPPYEYEHDMIKRRMRIVRKNNNRGKLLEPYHFEYRMKTPFKLGITSPYYKIKKIGITTVTQKRLNLGMNFLRYLQESKIDVTQHFINMHIH